MSWEMLLGLLTTVILPLIFGYQWGRKRKGKAEAVSEELKNQKSALDLYYETVAKLDEKDEKIDKLTKLVQEVSDQNMQLLKTHKEKDLAMEQMAQKLEKVLAQNKSFLSELKKLKSDYDKLVKQGESQTK